MSKTTVKQSIDIERLVTWALRDQGLGWVSSASRGDSLAGLAELGTRVDTSASGGLPPPGMGLCDNDDAMAVRAAVDRLPPDAAALVIVHGRVATRPDWGEEGFGQPEQRRNKRGQLKWLWRDPVKCRGRLGPDLDWPAYDHHVAQIEYERAQWTAWREALVALRIDLNCLPLATHVATGPMVAAEPWAGLGEAGPVPTPFGKPGAYMDAKRAAAQAPIRPGAVDWDYGPGKSTGGPRPKAQQNQGADAAAPSRGGERA